MAPQLLCWEIFKRGVDYRCDSRAEHAAPVPIAPSIPVQTRTPYSCSLYFLKLYSQFNVGLRECRKMHKQPCIDSKGSSECGRSNHFARCIFCMPTYVFLLSLDLCAVDVVLTQTEPVRLYFLCPEFNESACKSQITTWTKAKMWSAVPYLEITGPKILLKSLSAIKCGH